MKSTSCFALLFWILSQSLFSASPVPYSGKIDIGGVNYYGEVQFAFSLHDGNGTTHWRNGNQPGETIKVTIRKGRYNVLLGGQGMNSLPPELFLNHDKLYLKVEVDMEDGEGLRHLAPDQLITATPRALVAEVAKVAKVAEKVGNGAITRDMLASDVLADLNRTVTKQMLGQDILTDMNRTITASHLAQNTITTAQLNEQILKYLKPEIGQQPSIAGQISSGGSVSLSAQAEGKYLTYQWKKNGINLTGETNATLTIPDANASQHDGNYTLVVTNDFGSVETATISVNVGQGFIAHVVGLNASVQLEMLWVEPGTFTMGSPTSEPGRSTITDRETEHDVTLSKGFYLGKYEVTQALYEAVMTGNTDSLTATPSMQLSGNPDRPVETVSWADAQIFLTRLNGQQSANIPAGWSYVLPTEAEWEYACRAGTTTAYSWGNDINATRANYGVSGLSQTSDAGNYGANPWGFFDMHGNVNEWTADWYAVYSSGAQTDPTGPASGSDRVFRGGSWRDGGLRSANRGSNLPPPGDRGSNVGFRVGFKQQ